MSTNHIINNLMARPGLAAVFVSILLAAATAWWWRRRSFNLQAEITAVLESVPVATVGLRRARGLLKKIAAHEAKLAAAIARLRPLEGWDQAIHEAGPGLVPWRVLGYVAVLLAWPLQILLFAHAMLLTWAAIAGTLFDPAWTRLAEAICTAIAVGDGSRPQRTLRIARTLAAVWGAVAVTFVVAFFAARGLDIDIITESVAAYAWLILAAAAETAPIAAGAALAVARIMDMPAKRERNITDLRHQMEELERGRELINSYILKNEKADTGNRDDSGKPPGPGGPPTPSAPPPPNGGVHAAAALLLFAVLGASVTEAAPANRCVFGTDVSLSVAPDDRRHATEHLDAAGMAQAFECSGSLALSRVDGDGTFAPVAYIPIPTFREAVVCPPKGASEGDILARVFPQNFGPGLDHVRAKKCGEAHRQADVEAAERRQRFNSEVRDTLARLARDAHVTNHTCLVEAVEHLARRHQVLVLLGDAVPTCAPLPPHLNLPPSTRLVFLLTRQANDRPQEASHLATERSRRWRRAWPSVAFRPATDTPPDLWESIVDELARDRDGVRPVGGEGGGRFLTGQRR